MIIELIFSVYALGCLTPFIIKFIVWPYLKGETIVISYKKKEKKKEAKK